MRAIETCLLLAVAAVAAGCASFDADADFDRHSMSRLQEAPDGSGGLVFEARTSARYPAEDAAAEAARMAWLETWMKLRRLCPQAYEVIERRPFPPGDSNPHGYDLQYFLRCQSESPQ